MFSNSSGPANLKESTFANLQIQDSSVSNVAPFTVSTNGTNNFLGKSLEYQICIDSRNRDKLIYPEPNNFSLDLPFSRGLPVSRVTLASIELPLTQYIIEVNSNRIYFSEALDLIINDMESESLRNFTIEEYNGSVLAVQFPPYLNPIETISPIGTPLSAGDVITFTTTFTHSIETFGDIYESWGLSYPMTIIGTPLSTIQSAIATDEVTISRLVPSKNPYLQVISDTVFTLTLPSDFVGTVTFENNSSNSYGYVYSPGVPSPIFLANAIETILNSYTFRMNRYAVFFNGRTNTFGISIESLRDKSFINDLDQSEIQKCYTLSPAKLINNGGLTLASIMGFGCSDLPFPAFAGTTLSQSIGNPIGNCSDLSTNNGSGCNSCYGPYTKTFASIAGSRVFKSAKDSNVFYSTGSSFITDETQIKNLCSPTIQGEYGFQGISHCSIFPGNYNVEYFAIEMFLEMNRFYFPTNGTVSTPCVDYDNYPTPHFSFIDACSNCYNVELPYGRYIPTIFASALQDEMNVKAGNTDYVVKYNSTTDKIEFYTLSGLPFTLNFQNPITTSYIIIAGQKIAITMAERLGFINTNYSGQNFYTSDQKLNIPTKGLYYGSNCKKVYRTMNNIYLPVYNVLRKEFGVNPISINPMHGTIAASTNDTAIVTTSLEYRDTVLPASFQPFAHGLQPEDVVNIYVPSTGVTYTVVVSEIVSATQFKIDIGSIDPTLLDGSLEVCVSMASNPIANFYFGSFNTTMNSTSSSSSTNNSLGCYGDYNSSSGSINNNIASSIPPQILGFEPTARLWTSLTSFPYFASGVYNFDPPPYILIQISPNESRYIQHKYKNDNLTDIFAKLVLYPQFREIRSYDMSQQFSGLKIMNRIHFRILTPTHELYNFHGSDWSSTLIFTISGATGALSLY